MTKTTKEALGICLGASTISAVKLHKNGQGFEVKNVLLRPHEGNPKKIFEEVLREMNNPVLPVLITGRKFKNFVRFPSITETEAVEYALDHIQKDTKYDAIVAAGGETFMVYSLDKNNKIAGISTGNKCASGTGEFFLQQIRRMDLDIEQAISVAQGGEAYAVSGRCSVFCKSDCTHALNKGEPIANVTSGLCKMIAQKIIELLAKVPKKHVLMIGGTAKNDVVLKYIKEVIENVHVPEQAPYFEALGAAIAAFDKGTKKSVDFFSENHSHFNFLPALDKFEHLVTFNTMEFGKAKVQDRCIIGLDVGSTTTKAVILRPVDNSILASEYLRTNGNPVEASRKCYQSLLKKLNNVDINIVGIGVTGSGRRIAGLYSLTEGIINEIIAHASAAVFFDPEVDTIFEIGGQDAKYTFITNSVAADYAMNEACSAGTGSFLEESAHESLNVRVEEIADLAVQATRPPNFNDQCAAFISSDIKNATHEGISKEDILAGLVYSICFNYVNRVKGHRTVGRKVFLQGGVCYNRAVPLAMASVLQKPIIVPPQPGLMGAFGVALEVEKRISLGLLAEKKYSLEELVERKIAYEKPFICQGGKEKCDIKCSISRIRIENKLYPFGGACNRYNSYLKSDGEDIESLNLVKLRSRLMFETYAPQREIKPAAPVIGINRSLLTHWLYPLYYNFFSLLGCQVVLPDKFKEEAYNRQTTSMCFPVQLALAAFDELTDHKIDYIFMPHVEEMFVPGEALRKEFASTCIFVQGESFYMKRIFMDKNVAPKLLDPSINFSGGWEQGEEVFLEVAQQIGFKRSAAAVAFKEAVAMQRKFEAELKEIGRRTLLDLEKNPDKLGIVVIGRPYNSFTQEANKSIPRKLTTQNHVIIPFDMLPYDEEELGEDYSEYMHWELGHKILRAIQLISKNKQLFGVYITNFLCAIDSLLVTYYRKIMGTKPSLTLELDGHTADAGINTRIEAYYDIISNYLQVQNNLQAAQKSNFRQARVVMENGKSVYIDSKGEHIKLTDSRVKIIIPSLNDLAARCFAATCKTLGIQAQAMPIADAEVLQLGRGVTTCKECLPMILCIGSMLKYLKHRQNEDEKLVVFQPRAAGYCRLGQYHIFMNSLIKERQIKDVALISLANEERYAGLGTAFALKAWEALVIADVLDDIRGSLWALAVDSPEAERIFEEEVKKIVAVLNSGGSVYKQLKKSALEFKKIPLKQDYKITPKIIMMGEIFVRKDIFSNQDLARKIAEKGFVPRIAPIIEWIYYVAFLVKKKLVKPAFNGMVGWLEFYLSDLTQRFVELRVKKILARSGLNDTELINIKKMMKFSEHIFPLALKGEPGMIVGVTFMDGMNKYAGVVNIGPFGCMPVRFTEAVMNSINDVKAKKEAYVLAHENLDLGIHDDGDKIPFLTVEADGNPFPQLLEARFESFCLQSARVAFKMDQTPAVP